MKIIEAGNIMCKCGNDELVFVRALFPHRDTFVILCRKCKRKGSIKVGLSVELKDLPEEKE